MYTTLARVKAESKITTTNTTEDAYLWMLMGFVTGRIRAAAGFDFEPRYDTKRFDAFEENVNSRLGTFRLRTPDGVTQHLLEVSAITIDSTAYTYTTQVIMYPRGVTPASYLRLIDEDDTWYPCDRTYNAATESIVITGWWGYRTRYSTDGWLDSQDTVKDNPLSSSATEITVNDADGLDLHYRTPRFSAGNLIRIEDEMIEVLATNTSTNKLTVRRGVRGTTAVAHVQNTTIKVWEPEDVIWRVASRHVGQLYARKGAYQTAEIGDFGVIQYPADLAAEVWASLQEFAVS